jgi:predicted Zn-dependent protease
LKAEPTVDDVRWLAEHAPDRALEWVPLALEIQKEGEVRSLLRGALLRPPSSPIDAADQLSLLAELSAEQDARALHAAAAIVLEAQMTGEPALDRPWVTSIANERAAAVDVDGAIALLDGWTARTPDDPTFLLSAARLLLQADRPAEALQRCEQALPLSWGDNRLRVAKQKAQSLIALSRLDEARAFVAAALAEQPAPEGLDVRANRYRAELAATVEGR